MEAFDIGWIPQGWAKGDLLKVNNFSPIRFRMSDGSLIVFTIERDSPFAYDSSWKSGFVITVREDQIGVANAWIKWWESS